MDTATMEQLDPDVATTATGGRIRGNAKVPGTTVADIASELAAYPSLANAHALVQGPNGPMFGSPSDRALRSLDNTLAKIGLPAADPMTYTDYWRLEDSMYSVVEDYRDTPAHEPIPYKIGYALPALDGGPAPAPLMLWWALLLGLSSLVRYHPAAWTKAINLDASKLAVHLQRVLDIAAKRVPERLLGALRR